MSGKKGRSGRKPDAAVSNCRSSIDEAVKPADWRLIWRGLAAAAKKGNVQAARLLIEYRFGAASAQLPQTSYASNVVYYLPSGSAPLLPAGAVPILEPNGSLETASRPADRLLAQPRR